MASVGQIYYNVIDKNTGSCMSSGPTIFKENLPGEIVTRYGAKQFSKIGIEAPPGTIAIMNESKTIMIGQSGIYELDEDITITSLYFTRPPRYTKDIVASDLAIIDGLAIIRAAEAKQQADLAALGAEPNRSNEKKFKSYWDKHNAIQTVFIQEYNRGLNLFQIGNNGIYKLPNPSDITAPENYDDLYNVIINFIWD